MKPDIGVLGDLQPELADVEVERLVLVEDEELRVGDGGRTAWPRR